MEPFRTVAPRRSRSAHEVRAAAFEALARQVHAPLHRYAWRRVGDAADAVGIAVALTSTEGDALASCLPVTAEFLADMPVAFAATVAAVEGTRVTLAVDRWYAGGDADTVVVTQASEASMALIGGVEFVEGSGYLVTATDGVVNACGYSGPDTPELRAVFDDAFGG